jgi:hypothetical protein
MHDATNTSPRSTASRASYIDIVINPEKLSHSPPPLSNRRLFGH